MRSHLETLPQEHSPVWMAILGMVRSARPAPAPESNPSPDTNLHRECDHALDNGIKAYPDHAPEPENNPNVVGDGKDSPSPSPRKTLLGKDLIAGSDEGIGGCNEQEEEAHSEQGEDAQSEAGDMEQNEGAYAEASRAAIRLATPTLTLI